MDYMMKIKKITFNSEFIGFEDNAPDFLVNLDK